MPEQRQTYTAALKGDIALEAIKGQRSIHEIAGHYGGHPNQLTQWKKPALAEPPHVFSNRRARLAQDEAILRAQLYQQIGPLKVKLDWLPKKLACSVDVKCQMIEPVHPRISGRRHCELSDLSSAGLYYEPRC